MGGGGGTPSLHILQISNLPPPLVYINPTYHSCTMYNIFSFCCVSSQFLLLCFSLYIYIFFLFFIICFFSSTIYVLSFFFSITSFQFSFRFHFQTFFIPPAPPNMHRTLLHLISFLFCLSTFLSCVEFIQRLGIFYHNKQVGYCKKYLFCNIAIFKTCVVSRYIWFKAYIGLTNYVKKYILYFLNLSIFKNFFYFKVYLKLFI